jgi:hypothetical protein
MLLNFLNLRFIGAPWPARPAAAEREVGRGRYPLPHTAGWALSFSDGKVVVTAPTIESLGIVEVRAAIRLLRRRFRRRWAEVRSAMFDLSGVRSIAAPWTTVFALWIELGRGLPEGCRLTGLNEQPAALASVLLRGVSPGLLRIDAGPASRCA